MTANARDLCICGIRIPLARNRCLAFDKDKCLEPVFGDVGQAQTKTGRFRTDDWNNSKPTPQQPIPK